METIITLDKADSIEARRSSIRHEISKMIEIAPNEETKKSFKLSGELIIAIMDSQQDCPGVSIKDYMEKILPCAIASALNTTVRNMIQDQAHIPDGVVCIISKIAGFALTNMGPTNDG